MCNYSFLGKLIEITGIRKGKSKIIDITGERGTAETVVEARINCKNLLEKVSFLPSYFICLLLVFRNSFSF